MEYLTHYGGTGEGCDYTIGCNHAMRLIEAESMNDAIKKTVDGLMNGSGPFDLDLDGIQAVAIYEVAEKVDIDIDRIREEAQSRSIAAEAARCEEDERALFERLSKKYGQA